MVGIEVLDDNVVKIKLSDGRVVCVNELTVGKLPKMARLLKGVSIDTENLIGMIAEHGDQLIEAVSVGVEMELDDVRALDIEDFAAILSALLRVNKNFFLNRIAGIAETLQKALAG